MGLLRYGASILVVGCGNGLIAHTIKQRRPDVQICGVDVLAPEHTFIPVEKFDGEVLPFKDKSFDVILFVDVLYHTDDAMVMLREALRVARLPGLNQIQKCWRVRQANRLL